MLYDNLVTLRIGELEERIWQADLLDATLCDDLLVIEYFIFER